MKTAQDEKIIGKKLKELTDKVTDIYNSFTQGFGELPKIKVATKKDYEQELNIQKRFEEKNVGEEEIKDLAGYTFAKGICSYFAKTHTILFSEKNLSRGLTPEVQYSAVHEFGHAYQRNLGFDMRLNGGAEADMIKRSVAEGHADFTAIGVLETGQEALPEAWKYCKEYIRHQKELVTLARRVKARGRYEPEQRVKIKLEEPYIFGFSYMTKKVSEGMAPNDVLFNLPQRLEDLL